MTEPMRRNFFPAVGVQSAVLPEAVAVAVLKVVGVRRRSQLAPLYPDIAAVVASAVARLPESAGVDCASDEVFPATGTIGSPLEVVKSSMTPMVNALLMTTSRKKRPHSGMV